MRESEKPLDGVYRFFNSDAQYEMNRIKEKKKNLSANLGNYGVILSSHFKVLFLLINLWN